MRRDKRRTYIVTATTRHSRRFVTYTPPASQVHPYSVFVVVGHLLASTALLLAALAGQ